MLVLNEQDEMERKTKLQREREGGGSTTAAACASEKVQQVLP